MRTADLILYSGNEYRDLVDMVLAAAEGEDDRCAYIAGRLVAFAAENGFGGNLWHALLAYVIATDENAFSMACEIRGKTRGSINDIAFHDMAIFREWFGIDISSIGADGIFGILADYKSTGEKSCVFNKRIRDEILELGEKLASAQSTGSFKAAAEDFYGHYGVGRFGLHKAFRVKTVDEQTVIYPVKNIEHVYLDDLVGYQIQKKKLIDNTEAFVAGREANNCLLFGDSGTGKSSSIKAVLHRYYDRGLRMIEVYKYQFKDLQSIIAQVKNRNYRFIIYMDDLSFEEYEVEYKYLKAMIEGGLEQKPENVLIYATSNRRHLIRENHGDKHEGEDELHHSDTVQEKLSLASRFGVTIYYGRPEPKEFRQIVITLARRAGIDMPEDELMLEANKWELSHGGISGRTAVQFVTYLKGTRLAEGSSSSS